MNIADAQTHSRCPAGPSSPTCGDSFNSAGLVDSIRQWGQALGFSQIGIAGIDLTDCEARLQRWLQQGFHGQMHYMHSHGTKRTRPAELVPGTVSIITARMNYLPAATPPGWQAVEWARLRQPDEGIVSIYARGRDYHKVLRNRLQQLADRIASVVGPFGYRVFCDSAPVMEKPLALRSGLGWRGKHSMVLSRQGGSAFFLGEIYVDIPLPETPAVSGHCGTCADCITACPTGAIVAPYVVDARRCISYLTMVHEGSLPLELRPLMGNRIYGCDDCQLACPWNKFSCNSTVADFDARDWLVGRSLPELFAWDEATFLRRTEGSAIRRMGHERWLRNIAVALGNALRTLHASPQSGNLPAAHVAQQLRQALASRAAHPSEVVREHVQWALAQASESAPGLEAVPEFAVTTTTCAPTPAPT